MYLHYHGTKASIDRFFFNLSVNHEKKYSQYFKKNIIFKIFILRFFKLFYFQFFN